MDFSTAVNDLIKAHVSEVNALQKQISDLHILFGSNEKPAGRDKPAGLNSVAPEEDHQRPLNTPSHRGLGVSTPPMSPRFALGLHAPRGDIPKPCTPLLQESGLDKGFGSVIFESECYELEQESEGDMTASVYRWQALAEQILSNWASAHFVIHPGWTNRAKKSVRSLSADFQVHLSASGDSRCSSNLPTPLQGSSSNNIVVSDAQKAALSVQELKARGRLWSRSKILTSQKSRRKSLKSLSTSTRQSLANERFPLLRNAFDKGREFMLRILRKSSAESSTPGLSGFALHPASPIRRFWALCCMVVSFYELVALTMAPFGIMDGQTARGIEWISAVFWTIDIVANFCSGIYIQGSPETRFHIVCKRYMRTWFVFDLVVAFSQYLALLVEAEGLGATVLLRVTRVVRLFRVGRIFMWLKDILNLSTIALSRGKLLLFTIVLYFFVHGVACLLYEVGKTDNGWIAHYDDRMDDSVGHNYLVSLHWALSQLQGNVDIYPGRTPGALFFVVLSSWCSIVALTFFVSGATDTLSDVRQQEKRRTDDERLAFEFFLRHDIAPEIRARANHYLHQNEKQLSALKNKDQDHLALQLFPPQLRSLLLAEMRAFALTWHPIFSYLREHQRKVFVRLVATALSLQSYEPNEDVFMRGELAKNAYFVAIGDFVYNAISDFLSKMAGFLGTSSKDADPGQIEDECNASLGFGESTTDGHASASITDKDAYMFDDLTSKGKSIVRVATGRFVSEASLWMPWVHVGDFCSLDHGQCVAISTSDLIAALEKHPISYGVVASYARRFVMAAKTARKISNSDKMIELMDVQTVWDVEDGEFLGV